jgi:uncharacterized protein with NRDE domain
MCIAAFAWNPDSDTPLVLAANRDEFFARPAEPMHWWPDSPALAGRDLKGNGAWLGITQHGRFAFITNIRNPLLRKTGAPSRGQIVKDFLESAEPAAAFVTTLAAVAEYYEGFNFVCGDVRAGRCELWFLNSVERLAKRLDQGIYGLSNASLDTAWPKLTRIKDGLRHALAERDLVAREARLLRLLRNATPTPEKQLPRTGVPLAWERTLGSIFIRRDDYGTRASTVLQVTGGRVQISEVNHEASAGEGSRHDFSFAIAEKSTA